MAREVSRVSGGSEERLRSVPVHGVAEEAILALPPRASAQTHAGPTGPTSERR